MKRKLLSIAFFFGFFSSFSQITTSDSTFSSGDIPTEISFLNIDTSFESSCPDTLVVQIPSGNYVYWVDVEYEMTAANQAWMSEQVSYVECVSTGNKESQVYQGAANTGGTYSYTRNNINIADGISSAGTLKFVLHAFREWGGTGCNTTFNKVDNNSWTITVHHGPAP